MNIFFLIWGFPDCQLLFLKKNINFSDQKKVLWATNRQILYLTSSTSNYFLGKLIFKWLREKSLHWVIINSGFNWNRIELTSVFWHEIVWLDCLIGLSDCQITFLIKLDSETEGLGYFLLKLQIWISECHFPPFFLKVACGGSISEVIFGPV